MSVLSTAEILGLLFAGFAAFILTMRILRRRVRRAGDELLPPAFDLAELDQMRATGKITAEEFERLKAAALQQRIEMGPLPGPRGFDVIPKAPPPDVPR